jgi:glycosyltransferase involved in cell wall biosynthesis
MRILHVVTVVDEQNSRGGPLAVALGQCAELARRGHQVCLTAGGSGPGTAAVPGTVQAAGTGGPPRELEGVPCRLFPARVVVPGMELSGLLSWRMLGWAVRHARSYQVVHVHLARDLIPLLFCVVLRVLRVPYVVQTHGMVVPDRRGVCRLLDALLTVPTLRAARARYVLTPQEQHALGRVAGPGAALTRLGNGITVPPPAAPIGPPRVPDVLFLARLHPRKRVRTFVQAAIRLLDEGVDATFSVVGGDDGDLNRLVAALYARPDLADRLRYEGALGHREALERLGRASLYVLPSVDEPYPITVLEAMARGVSVVCTTSCGLAEPLQALGVAEVTEPDLDSLTGCLRRLLADPVALAERGRNARKAVAEFFSIAAVVDRLEDGYRARTQAGD